MSVSEKAVHSARELPAPPGMPTLLDELIRRRRDRQVVMAARLENLSQQLGKVLFDGEWVDPDEMRRRYRRLRTRHWLQIGELAVLLLAILAMGGVCFTLLLLLYL